MDFFEQYKWLDNNSKQVFPSNISTFEHVVNQKFTLVWELSDQ